MRKTAWQDAGVAVNFLDERRAAMPFAAEQLALMLQLVTHFRPGPQRILDLGCGDGLLARTLLDQHPQASAVLVDHSVPMLERAATAMAPYGVRARLVNADLAQPLPATVGTQPFDVVVSGYAIHHLPDERKRALYEEIFALLVPDGLFVNLEHVCSATTRIEELWNEQMVESLTRVAGKPREKVAIEYYGRPDRVDNILAPVETQLAWLREIGFAEVDCYFKWLELAVFAGVRPQLASAG